MKILESIDQHLFNSVSSLKYLLLLSATLMWLFIDGGTLSVMINVAALLLFYVTNFAHQILAKEWMIVLLNISMMVLLIVTAVLVLFY